MSINLIPEDALPKSNFLEPEFRRERDWREREANGLGGRKSPFISGAEREGRIVQEDGKSRAAVTKP